MQHFTATSVKNKTQIFHDFIATKIVLLFIHTPDKRSPDEVDRSHVFILCKVAY